MSSNELWFAQVSGVLFTHFVTRMKKLTNKKIKYTQSNSDISPTSLPAIHFQEVEPVEVGSDIDNTGIHAVRETIQLTVYGNGQMSEVKDIMSKGVVCMKQMRFNMTGMPVYTTNHDIKQGVARFRRLIGASDII